MEKTMNTQVERVASHRNTRVLGLTSLGRLRAWARLKYEAFRMRLRENEARDALMAMSPELLDDIGVKVDPSGNPTPKFADHNPFVIATDALTPKKRHQDPY